MVDIFMDRAATDRAIADRPAANRAIIDWAAADRADRHGSGYTDFSQGVVFSLLFMVN